MGIQKHFPAKDGTTVPAQPSKYTHSGLPNESTFNPKTLAHQFIDVFKNMVEADIGKSQYREILKTNKFGRELEQSNKEKTL